MMEMQSYSVGDIVCSPSNDEAIFDLTDNGALLLLKYRNPKSAEKNSIKSRLTRFKLASVDGILFFLARFDTANWVDAPYHRDLSRYTLFRPEKEMGLLLHVMLIDAATGRLVAQRAIGLSTQFSSDLLDAAAQQPKLVNRDAYLATLNSVYQRYTTNDLVDISVSDNG